MMPEPKEILNLEANLFPKENIDGGICLACVHFKGCTYPREKNAHVVQCEDFCGYAPGLTQKKKCQDCYYE